MKALIKTIGTSDKEAETFLKLLELGAQPVSVLAKQMSLPRSSMYVILEKLKKLNLIEEFERAGIRYVKCIPAASIADVLKAKEKKIQQSLEILQEKLPQLEELENRLSITPKIKFHEGKSAVTKMYEEILKEKEFYAFFNPQSVLEIMPEYYYKIPEGIKAGKGKAKEIVVDCPEGRKYKKDYSSKNHQIKILPSGAIFNSDTIICEDKIYMTGYGENQVSGTEIFNSSLAHSQRVIFEQLWRKL